MVRRIALANLSREEIRLWIEVTRHALEHKMHRERVYLERRARRGIRTPIDEAYEADQELEADLLAFLDEMEQHLDSGMI